MKVVIAKVGWFGLSDAAIRWLADHGSHLVTVKDGMASVDIDGCPRSDPLLVKCVEELGSKAGTGWSILKAIEVPDDVQWHIQEYCRYDGSEYVAEDHREWS